MPTVLGSFAVGLQFAGTCEFTDPILLVQQRDDADPPESFDLDLTLERALWDAITARVRWAGSVLEFGGDAFLPPPVDTGAGAGWVGTIGPARTPGEIVVLGRQAAVSFEEAWQPGEQATMRFSVVGDRWAIPSQDYVPPPPDTCPATIPISARRSPKMLGNKPTSLVLLLGQSPAKMQAWRLFQGYSLQKSNRGNVGILGEITAVDDSILYAEKPLCLQILPFGGLRRDEIVRLAAAAVGLDPVTQVICPIGKIITKPILLTNASLLPFVNEFVAAENWFASFDAFGRLWIREIERKDAPDLPDWTLDANLGDFDYDSLEEIPPAKPPTTIYTQVLKPVRGTGPDGSPLTITNRTTEVFEELYALETVKVPASGATPFLYSDGSYRTTQNQELMVVQRKITDVTTVNGNETKRVVTTFRIYNPRAYNPNFDVYPPTNLYDLAYGNKSFHRDEVESLMETSEDVTDTIRDIYGTILGTRQQTKGWYAPHRAAVFDSGRSRIINDAAATPPAYVYAGGTTRVLPVEEYLVTGKLEKDYLYGPDGSLLSIDERRSGWYAPDSRSDLIQTIVTPDSGPPEDDSDPAAPPWENPPPEEPPAGPPWHPQLSGPIAQNGGKFTFRIAIIDPPPGGVVPGVVGLQGRLITSGAPPPYGSVSGTTFGQTASGDAGHLNPTNELESVASIRFSGTKPVGTVYVFFSITVAATVNRFSNTIAFDPWAGVPEGGTL